MDTEQFETLGERISFDFDDQGKSMVSKGKRSSLNIARRLTYVLFDEIIEDSPSQTRSVIFDPKRNPEDVELMESIKQHGIINPIMIRGLGKEADLKSFNQKKSGERNFALVAGHRRVAAGRAAGLSGTEAVVAKSSDDFQLLTLVENMGRRELTSYEKALALKNLKLRLKLSVRKVAEITGYSRTHVSRLLTSLDSPEMLQKLWKRGDLSASVIVILKEHWQRFSDDAYDHLAKDLRKLSQNDAFNLRVQLDSGIDIETAVHTVKSRSPIPSNSKIENNEKPITDEPIKKSIEEEIVARNTKKIGLYKALQKNFPVLNEEEIKALADSAIASNVLDADVVWVAALYVARGGPVENAMELSIKVMHNKLLRKQLTVDLKSIRQISYYLKFMSLDSDLKKFIKTIYLGC